ncbi:uncharacterized protein METZ01_LOCUS213081, partial [marine metagenome]
VADQNSIPFGARFWCLWRPVWRFRHKANGLLFPFLLVCWGGLLVGLPYMVANRLAAAADHTLI